MRSLIIARSQKSIFDGPGVAKSKKVKFYKEVRKSECDWCEALGFEVAKPRLTTITTLI